MKRIILSVMALAAAGVVTGKELDLIHGLNTYDYGARQYDPILARWDRMDPLCEKYYSISPYAYCANNPVNAIAPDGRIVKALDRQSCLVKFWCNFSLPRCLVLCNYLLPLQLSLR